MTDREAVPEAHRPAEHAPPRREPVPRAQATLAYQMLPEDANSQGFVHGGSVTKLADTAAGVCAARHARCRVATVLISQNKPNYLAAMGGEAGRHRVEAFLGNMGTKIFHAIQPP